MNRKYDVDNKVMAKAESKPKQPTVHLLRKYHHSLNRKPLHPPDGLE